MRPILEEQLSEGALPFIEAHAGCTTGGRENSIEAITRSLAIFPNILIEIDVRKSADCVLYCHHGSIPFGVSIAAFFGFLSFERIQRLVGPRDTLKAILDVIPQENTIYLDIKDRSISADDLRRVLGSRKRLWIGPITSIRHLQELRLGLGEEYLYGFSRPVLFPRRAAKRLEGLSDFVQSFWWNWTPDTIRAVEARGMLYHPVEWYISRKRYLRLLERSRYRGFFVWFRSLPDLAAIEKLH